MSIKITWKSVTGLLSMAAGAVTSAQSTVGLPHWASGALVAAGGVILSAERVADAVDYRTDQLVTKAKTVEAANPALTAAVKADVAPVVEKVETAVDTEKAKILAEHPNLSDEISAARAKANEALVELENLGGLATKVQSTDPPTVAAAAAGAETVQATTL